MIHTTDPAAAQLSFMVDADDERDILAAVAYYQRTRRVQGELMIGEGGGDLRGRILGCICRAWMDSRRRKR